MTRWLGPLLLIGVFARHDLTWLPGYSRPEWFYILGGLYEIVLCSILLLLLSHPLAVAALWVGIIEGSQVAVCGAMMGHQRAPEGVNECDFLTGLPVGAWLTWLEVAIVCILLGKNWYLESRS